MLTDRKSVTLALQGGGSHGAFTWGVLDRLLEDRRVRIEGISGASAGAMNAVVLAHGMTVGGREGARQALSDFWEAVAGTAPFSQWPESLLGATRGSTSGLPVAYKPMLSLLRVFSPYQLNPFDINPLRAILARQVDFDGVRKRCPMRLFIATTHVATGTLKLFRTRQLSLDVLLASACLPLLHRAVEIDGEVYWDGGLTANPPLLPLVQRCSARDIIAVLLHPCPGTRLPVTAEAISHRLAEMNFSSTFFAELQVLVQAQREAKRSWFAVGRMERRLRGLNMHAVESGDMMSSLGRHSKLNAHPAFIRRLHAEGRERAHAWLQQNFRDLGVRSSFRPSRLFG
ncbi:MAG TPA: patatin-like phospholipase family protein [Noviherbaspirillum sp.]|jgi:NTE family protein|uniref:patatin-like phospholipase family protein n=1 Tax=Noviherbaspirillum sp. TaxID=1926288 RepID=UPI002F9367DD